MHRSALVVLLGCTHPATEPPRTAAAPRPDAIDGFSPTAGHLMVRGG